MVLSRVFIHDCPHFPSKWFGAGIWVLPELGLLEYLQPWTLIVEPKLFPDNKLAVLSVEAMFRALGHKGSCYLEEGIYPLGEIGSTRIMHMCITHISMPPFCTTTALLEREKLSNNLGPLQMQIGSWALGQCSLSSQVTWECAQGCWEDAALIGVYGLVGLGLVFAFFQRDTWASLYVIGLGLSPLLCLLWLLVLSRGSLCLGEWIFLKAFLAKEGFSTVIMVAATYGGLPQCSVLCQGDLACISCSQQTVQVGVLLAILHKRTLGLYKAGWVPQCVQLMSCRAGAFDGSFALQGHLVLPASRSFCLGSHPSTVSWFFSVCPLTWW